MRESVQSIKDAPFDFTAGAELFPCRYSKNKRPIGYKRFDTAAEAIRFAIEDLPAPLLNGTFLEVNNQRFKGGGIRALCERANYPLSRACEASKTCGKNQNTRSESIAGIGSRQQRRSGVACAEEENAA